MRAGVWNEWISGLRIQDALVYVRKMRRGGRDAYPEYKDRK